MNTYRSVFAGSTFVKMPKTEEEMIALINTDVHIGDESYNMGFPLLEANQHFMKYYRDFYEKYKLLFES